MFHQEEWVVCRIFQKSTTVKRAQQIASSPASQGDDESACDTNAMVNEVGDMELPNLSGNSIAMSDNILLQNYNATHDTTNILNWNTATDAAVSSLTWPLSMNSLLLTALHLRGHDNYSLMPPQTNNMSQFGNHYLASNMQAASTSSLPLPPPTEQPPYNVDSNIW